MFLLKVFFVVSYYFQNHACLYSLGSEVALETAGSILAGKYGGLATKFIASKTGLIEVSLH